MFLACSIKEITEFMYTGEESRTKASLLSSYEGVPDQANLESKGIETTVPVPYIEHSMRNGRTSQEC